VDSASNDLEELNKIARGERAKRLRAQLRLSRPDCVRKFNIPIGSLQSWEEARYGGLTMKGAKRLIEAYAQEGLICSLEWLFDGTGPTPRFSHKEIFLNPDENKSPLAATISLNGNIQQELILFHKHNSNAIDTLIPDNALAPYLQKGDLVAGVRYFAEDIDKGIGTLCIVQTAAGEILVGYLYPDETHTTYSLFNCSKEDEKPVKENLKLFSAAPVLWIRRI
jgi:transcriptional regulator with XRE-family HTH domain